MICFLLKKKQESNNLFLFKRWSWANCYITTILLLLSSFKYPVLEKKKNHDNNNPRKYKNESKTQFFILLYIGFLSIALIYSQLRVTYPFYLQTYYQLNECLFSNLFVINTLLIAILQVPLLNITRSFNSILISGIGALFIGFGMGLLIFGSSYSFAIFLCTVWTLGEILYFSTVQVIIYDNAHEYHKGKHMGTYQFIMASAYMIGPIIGSVTYHYDPNLIWICCILLGVFTFLLHAKTIYFKRPL